MEQTSGFIPNQATQSLPTPMDTRRDGVQPPLSHEAPYAAFVAEAAIREAALQQQVGYLSEQLAALSARYSFSPSHCL